VQGEVRRAGDPLRVAADPSRGAAGPPRGAAGPVRRRPLVERLGMAAIAAAIAVAFAAVALASLSGGDPFLAAMAGLGALMTLWAGAVTLFRG
jgi:hypothetical protein